MEKTPPDVAFYEIDRVAYTKAVGLNHHPGHVITGFVWFDGRHLLYMRGRVCILGLRLSSAWDCVQQAKRDGENYDG
jgi:hypothetical protein